MQDYFGKHGIWKVDAIFFFFDTEIWPSVSLAFSVCWESYLVVKQRWQSKWKIYALLLPVEEVSENRGAPYSYLTADTSFNFLKGSKLQLPEYLKDKMYWHHCLIYSGFNKEINGLNFASSNTSVR